MNSNYEYISEVDHISDNDIQEVVESSTSISRRKAVDKPAEEPRAETECNMSYKHDRSTENIKTHLRSVHKIFGPNESLSSNKKQQLSISDIIRQVKPHNTSRQSELQRITTE
ncbi:12411_t:CDS:2 [Cetraspora pellucida]|uniref:12411_t:CDS:1 n=1 Tax=Cetraspora pellucida TaxID=1433469 RepID=A0ACA9LB41_9GLOM|nr:12411_t:CDS:2 [Cetraspora pellucida]